MKRIPASIQSDIIDPHDKNRFSKLEICIILNLHKNLIFSLWITYFKLVHLSGWPFMYLESEINFMVSAIDKNISMGRLLTKCRNESGYIRKKNTWILELRTAVLWSRQIFLAVRFWKVPFLKCSGFKKFRFKSIGTRAGPDFKFWLQKLLKKNLKKFKETKNWVQFKIILFAILHNIFACKHWEFSSTALVQFRIYGIWP